MGVQIFQGAGRQRARLMGELNRLKKQIETAHARIEELEVMIVAYDTVLKAQQVDANPDDLYPPRAPSSKRGYFAYAEFSKLILRALREARAPLSTSEIFTYMLRESAVIFHSARDRTEFRKKVNDRLSVYRNKGVVVKVFEAETKGAQPSIWSLPEFAQLPHPLLEGKAKLR